MRRRRRTLQAQRDGWGALDADQKERVLLCVIQHLIWLDMLPAVGRPKDERWNLLGLAICLPLYGYGLYKLLVS